MSVSPFPALPATAPYSGSTISTTTTTTKSPPTLANIVKSATPPSLPQLPPHVAASPPALRRTSPTQSRDEDQSMDQSMLDSKPALASPPPTLSHTALPASTASAIAGSPGSSASPKPLHSNSTSSPLLNHAAQLTAAQAPSQLALLLSPRLQMRTHSVANLPSRRAAPLAPSAFWHRSKACLLALPRQMWTEKREREKVVKEVSKVPGSAVKAVPDAEARADRAECAHVDLAASLQSVRSSQRLNGTSTCARAAPPMRTPLLRASSRRRRTPPWRIPVTYRRLF
ncbi:hypothetical protein DFH11DRAFT_259461 [Phellopilus nigrolimitatus]|nr:hypothetical protein DFH11DRAFT_259461 [Phellopilus nigrolimitatus]